MAKKRQTSVSLFKVTDSGCELKARIEYSLKLDNTDVGQPHVVNFDLSMTRDQLIDKCLSTLVIDWQKQARSMGSHAKVRDAEGKAILYEDIYKSISRVSVTKDMTPEQIVAKAKADPKFRASLMAELAEMQDELDAE